MLPTAPSYSPWRVPSPPDTHVPVTCCPDEQAHSDPSLLLAAWLPPGPWSSCLLAAQLLTARGPCFPSRPSGPAAATPFSSWLCF